MVLALLEWTRLRTPVEAALWSLLVNVVVFVVALAFGALSVRLFRGSPVSPEPEPLTGSELMLAAVCVVLNSGVMWAGWWLFREGALGVEAVASPVRVVVDALVLVAVMDLAMYLTHRLAHHPVIFRHVHGVHHRYERVRPLTLFVLHPLEVLGFGALWITVLVAHTFSLGGMLLYLTVNTLFGVVGHLGVEPVPRWLRALPVVRAIGTSSFHAGHHLSPRTNFGFYTSFWDRLFRTLAH